MQYEYDRSVEQIKEGREGLAQYRALVERVTRQVDESRKHVSLLEAKVKAYLNAGDRDTASKFALELKRAKDDSAENEKQLALHEQAYQNNLLKIQNAVKKLDDVRHKISKYDAELKMSRAEAEMSALATQFHFNVTTDFGQAEQVLQDQIDKNRAGSASRPISLAKASRRSGAKPPSRRPWLTMRCANSRCRRGWPLPRRPRFRRRLKSWGRRPRRWRRCRRFDLGKLPMSWGGSVNRGGDAGFGQ